ncbi:MAG TPA: flagellar hook capping FlgD N-terminal domain-containing protein [Bryobacteraceae bacterium]|nr:flagellar hook capping FlgD N-terminal domain-containing protein [Bryobacteraceae bacterium]
MIPSLAGGTSNTQQLTDAQPGVTAAPSGTDSLANEQTFLKLFVAQLKNQNPMQPQDASQFMAQLAQFTSLEQELQMRQDLDAIKALDTKNSGTPAATQ